MTAEPHPQRCETCNKIECVFSLTKWYSTWHSDLYYFIDKMGCASHSSAKSERGNCPQNKIWDHCPVSERIRQDEREKVLKELISKVNEKQRKSIIETAIGIKDLFRIVDSLRSKQGEQP